MKSIKIKLVSLKSSLTQPRFTFKLAYAFYAHLIQYGPNYIWSLSIHSGRRVDLTKVQSVETELFHADTDHANGNRPSNMTENHKQHAT
jgi:hypothetical protein